MSRVLAIIGMSVGGWIGWDIGAVVSTFTGFIMCVFGTALGLYAARRFDARYLP